VRTPEIFMGEVSDMSQLRLEGVLKDADEVMEALADGAVVKAVHLYYPEVHWAKLDGDRVIERVVNSATGEILLPEVSFGKYHYALLVKDAIETGWLFSVPEAEAVEKVFGGEQE
jgi:hypothetical protein